MIVVPIFLRSDDMYQTPEQHAREQIEAQLDAAGWAVQDSASVNLAAGRGIAVREFQLSKGHGAADYLLYGDRKVLGVIEAKKEGVPVLWRRSADREVQRRAPGQHPGLGSAAALPLPVHRR